MYVCLPCPWMQTQWFVFKYVKICFKSSEDNIMMYTIDIRLQSLINSVSIKDYNYWFKVYQ